MAYPQLGSYSPIRNELAFHHQESPRFICGECQYYYNETAPLYLLFAYPKGFQENLTEDEKKVLRTFVEILKRQFKSHKGGRGDE